MEKLEVLEEIRGNDIAVTGFKKGRLDKTFLTVFL